VKCSSRRRAGAHRGPRRHATTMCAKVCAAGGRKRAQQARLRCVCVRGVGGVRVPPSQRVGVVQPQKSTSNRSITVHRQAATARRASPTRVSCSRRDAARQQLSNHPAVMRQRAASVPRSAEELLFIRYSRRRVWRAEITPRKRRSARYIPATAIVYACRATVPHEDCWAQPVGVGGGDGAQKKKQKMRRGRWRCNAGVPARLVRSSYILKRTNALWTAAVLPVPPGRREARKFFSGTDACRSHACASVLPERCETMTTGEVGYGSCGSVIRRRVASLMLSLQCAKQRTFTLAQRYHASDRYGCL